MNLLLVLLLRELRFRWKQLVPFVIISSALIFTLVNYVTCQECLNAVVAEDYMMTASAMILFSAFTLIAYVSSRTYFYLYSSGSASDTGVLRALGMKNRDIHRIRIFPGCLCILLSLLIAVPAALVYMYIFVSVCAGGDMAATGLVPMAFRIPVLNLTAVLVPLLAALTAGVFTGCPREKSIVSLIRSSAQEPEAENDSGTLPEEGSLSDYGRLYVKRSVNRSIRYNLIVAFLLILPVIFLLGMVSLKSDRSTYTFSLTADGTILTDTMVSEIDRIPGTAHVKGSGRKSSSAGYGRILIYAEENADPTALKNRVSHYAQQHSALFADSSSIREEYNRITGCYRSYFLTQAVILFAVGYITAYTMLKARLTARKRELSLLRAIGAGTEDILSAVIPETVADYAFGALLSILLGVFGVFGMMSQDGGSLDLVSVLVLCFLFLAGNVYLQIRSAGRLTARILTGTTHDH